MSKKAVEPINPFVQVPKNYSPMYEFNETTRTLELMEFRDDVKFIESNKNLTFKEMLEKYGPGFVNNKNNGFELDETLIYKDINKMWNDGQEYQKKLKESKQSTSIIEESKKEIEKINNVEVNNEQQ